MLRCEVGDMSALGSSERPIRHPGRRAPRRPDLSDFFLDAGILPDFNHSRETRVREENRYRHLLGQPISLLAPRQDGLPRGEGTRIMQSV
jgi:hypothetical protein